VIHRSYDAGMVGSKRLRRGAEARVLRAHGDCIAVYELQGQLTLFSMERVVRELMELPDRVQYLVVDFRRVLSADDSALDVWLSYLAQNGGRYEIVFLSEFDHCPRLRERLQGMAKGWATGDFGCAAETDAAVEICENHLLERVLGTSVGEGAFPLEEFDICAGLEPARIEALRQVLEVRSYDAGETIIRNGDPANSLFLLSRGQVSVTIDLPTGGSHRLATCTPGMMFGEMAILERRPRSAAVRADCPVECYAMPIDTFDRLTATHPDLKVKLLENFAYNLSLRVRRLTDEVRVLSE
jgi:glutaminase